MAAAMSKISMAGAFPPADEPSKLPVVGGRGVIAGVVGAVVVVVAGGWVAAPPAVRSRVFSWKFRHVPV
jgi:hypothetical protein